jgi:hypothetical protein
VSVTKNKKQKTNMLHFDNLKLGTKIWWCGSDYNIPYEVESEPVLIMSISDKDSLEESDVASYWEMKLKNAFTGEVVSICSNSQSSFEDLYDIPAYTKHLTGYLEIPEEVQDLIERGWNIR